MNSKYRFILKEILPIVVVIILFILVSYFVQRNLEFFESLIGNNLTGYLIYMLLIIVATVFAPITMIPIMPMMSMVFGWKLNGFLTWIAWSIGSIIAFYIARKYGVKIVSKLVSIDNITKYEKMLPTKNLFLSVLLLRMSVPADILSYLLGLFSKISYKSHALATIIGILPFSFILAYLGVVPILYQIIVFSVIIVIMIISFVYISKKSKK